MSAKRRAQLPARREAVAIALARDGRCQFPVRLLAYLEAEGDFPYPVWACFGPLVGHEPLKRSQGADITDPDQIVILCSWHNSFVEEYPTARKLLGL